MAQLISPKAPGRSTRPRVSLIACLAAAFVSLVAPTSASANTFDVYGAGARGSALGSAQVADPLGAAAVYYNPAAMSLSKASVSGGIVGMVNNARITLSDRPAGYDIPDLGNNSPAVPSQYRLNVRGAADLSSTGGFYIGAITEPGFDFLRLGLLAYIPILGTGNSHSVFPDERESLYSNKLSWELIGGRVEHAAVLLAVSIRPVSALSIGLGVSYMAGADTQNAVYLDNIANQDEVDINVGLKIKNRFRPTLGVLITPHKNLRIGITARYRQWLTVDGANIIQVRGLQGTEDYPFNQTLGLVLQYSPTQVVVGTSAVFERITGSIDATYNLWSDYRAHHGEKAGFRDTLVPRASFEYNLRGEHFFRMGLQYETTPVRPQTGRTNFVDNSRAVVSAGTGHRFDVKGHTLSVDWAVQVHTLVGRSTAKEVPAAYQPCSTATTAICDEVPDDSLDPSTGVPIAAAQGLQTSNPGFPGFSSGGWLATGTVDATWEF